MPKRDRWSPWVPSGIFVHEDERRGAQLQGTLHDFAGIDRGVVDGAALLPLMRDQHILAVEEQQVEFLDLAIGVWAVQ